VTAAATPAALDVGTWRLNAGAPEWLIDRLAPGLEPTASFTLTLTPTAADVGKILVISGRTTVSATDATTGGAVTAAGNVATTNLDGDSIARGQGVVER
jgi:hypothetical protein